MKSIVQLKTNIFIFTLLYVVDNRFNRFIFNSKLFQSCQYFSEITTRKTVNFTRMSNVFVLLENQSIKISKNCRSFLFTNTIFNLFYFFFPRTNNISQIVLFRHYNRFIILNVLVTQK